MPTRRETRRSGRPPAWIPGTLCLLCLMAQLAATSGALFAVDVGTEYMKVSLIKPGREPISIVTNEMSKRKTVADVAIVNGERLMGAEATALRTRHPGRVFTRLRDFLGKPAGHASVSRALRAETRTPLVYELVEDPQRQTVRFKTGDDSTISAEELMGSIITYAKAMAEAQAGQDIVDCVIALPCFFGPAQRQAILDAARLAGANVLALVHSNAAAALQYGIVRDFSNTTENVIFYDMGSNAVQVAYITFSSYQTRDKGKMKTINQLRVLDVAWDDDLGGDHLDWMLVDHIADEFQEKYGLDPRDSPKAIAKMKKAVRRTKEILSANSDAPVYVEELHDNKDFSSKITRREFEDLAADFFERAKNPLVEILERNNLSVASLDGVELLGGGTRVPKLQAVLSEALGGRNLDRHLDGDEAIVMGAGLVAANLSTTFRLRQFGLVDGAVYPMSVQIEEPPQWTAPAHAASDDAEQLFKPRALLPYMKRLPVKRILHLANFTADPFNVSFAFNTSGGRPLPSGMETTDYGTYEVSGMKKAVEKHGQDGKVALHFTTQNDGIIVLKGAEYVAEVQPNVPSVAKENDTANETRDSVPEINDEVQEDSTDGDEGDASDTPESKDDAQDDSSDGYAEDAGDGQRSSTSNSTDSDSAASEDRQVLDNNAIPDNSTAKNETAKAPKTVKKKTVRFPLIVSQPELTHPSLDTKGLLASTKVLLEFSKKEMEKKAGDAAKNSLESYILSTQEMLGVDENIKKVTTEEQRNTFSLELTETEDWLYMEGEDQPAAEFKKRLAELEAVGKKMVENAAELTRRPEAVKTAQDSIELLRKVINTWPETKPWLNETEVEKFANKTDAFEEWLTGVVAEQSSREPHEDPAFRSEDVMFRFNALNKVFNKLKNKKAPKPPPQAPIVIENMTITENGTFYGVGGNETGIEENIAVDLEQEKDVPQDHDEL
ncbi:unnamed protein product [Ostreobium quekettii]|uniref:Uncharacterized protein n=1 Tax=Ostreobium quekettii TaxID=121088 RepID=A0A8S1J7C0_9CHLO|nr:unnamed protein product [Ostreobium quekettii]|eukprot:evm.model.scf_531.10 EVM.evm.TU.scf_531.10   scf_531:67702-74338(-)